MNPKEFFSNQLKSSLSTVESLSRQVLRLSVIRFAVFLIFLIALIWFANARMGYAVTAVVVLFPIVFGIIVKRFNSKSNLRKLYSTIADRYARELDRLSFNLNIIDGGNAFIDRNHHYSYDLDIFGNHSLFQLLNRTATPYGYQRLAEILTVLPEREDISKRQEAIRELSEDPAWLIHVFSEGNVEDETAASVASLEAWLIEKGPPSRSIPNGLAIVLTLFMLLIIGLVIFTSLSYQILIIPILINIFVLGRLQANIKNISKQVSGNVQLLRAYERMIVMFQEKSFESELLNELHTPFHAASVKSIRSLRKLLDYLNARSNLFFGLLDLLFLLDVYLVNGFASWRKNNREDLSQWFRNIAEMEVLGSTALHAYANPDHSYPELSEQPMEWSAEELGHPLIPPSERVCNDYQMNDTSPLAIVTGSNMSGKSTFLRTVGINTVLAYSGAPVAAGKLRLGMFRLFTAMRTEDDLSSNISSFYAELKRIKALLDSLDDRPTLCLLDEILKGTNTEDRHRGAKGLLRQLSEASVAGLVSTHDLALGRWGEANGFANFSFNSSITDAQIHFDYRITPGICHSFNASQLMKNMGIRLPREGMD